MRVRNAAAAILVLSVATVWAQSTSPAVRLGSRAVPVQATVGNKVAGAQTPDALRQRMQDMESTLNKMHAVLKQMRARAASRKDQATRDNLEMWELMVGQLDKQFDQLRVATLTREDLEARRAAMYQQAMARAAAARPGARGSTPEQATAAAAQGTAAATTGPGTAGAASSPSTPIPPSPR